MSAPLPDELMDRVTAWALGELAPSEAAALEAEAREHPALAEVMRETREALAGFALSEPIAPPPALRDRVMAAIPDATATTPRREDATVVPIARRRTAWLPVTLGLGLAASLVLLVQSNTERANERAAAADALAQLQARLDAREALLARLTDPSTEVITLAATDDAPRIRIVVDRQRKVAVLSAAQLAEPEAGKTYQLWRIVDGAPVPSVTFRPDAQGTVAALEVPVPADGELTALAVTLEPDGGSTTPTLPILFVGAVGTTR